MAGEVSSRGGVEAGLPLALGSTVLGGTLAGMARHEGSQGDWQGGDMGHIENMLQYAQM
jgi:hypothetical protein